MSFKYQKFIVKKPEIRLLEGVSPILLQFKIWYNLTFARYRILLHSLVISHSVIDRMNVLDTLRRQ